MSQDVIPSEYALQLLTPMSLSWLSFERLIGPVALVSGFVAAVNRTAYPTIAELDLHASCAIKKFLYAPHSIVSFAADNPRSADYTLQAEEGKQRAAL